MTPAYPAGNRQSKRIDHIVAYSYYHVAFKQESRAARNGARDIATGLTTTTGKAVIMADSDSSEFISHKEAAALADELARFGGKHSLATRLAAIEAKCRRAGRLIKAMLRQTNSGDIWKLPPEA
jgi:hypothetical protein